VANPNGHKLRVRSWIHGVVVGAVGENKYKVRFENDEEIYCVSSSLRIESHDLGVPLSEAQTLVAHVEEHDHAFLADDEEEEDEGLGDLLAAVEQEGLVEDGNIATDPFEDLFGHQDEFLQNLNESGAPSPEIFFGLPTPQHLTLYRTRLRRHQTSWPHPTILITRLLHRSFRLQPSHLLP
jgi:hypothetical protein